jgi:hypothetical protein
MLMFKPDLALLVMDGAKTVTRRAVNDNPRSLWGGQREVRGVHAVVPGRGLHQVGKVEVTRVDRERLHLVMTRPGEARREGFATPDAFKARWLAMHGSWDPVAWVWRVQFHVVEVAPCTCRPVGMGPGGTICEHNDACVWHGDHGIRVASVSSSPLAAAR